LLRIKTINQINHISPYFILYSEVSILMGG